MATLKSKMRKSLMSSHGARKNTRNSLWLVYSPKSNSDLALASTNECVYWITHLESDQSVQSFEFGYSAELKIERDPKFRVKEVIYVERTNGEVEIHTLSSGSDGVTESTGVLKARHKGKGVLLEKEVKVIRVYDEYLGQHAQRASRLLRVVGFASQLRGRRNDVTSAAVELALRTLKSGRVEQILLATHRHDPMIVLGVVSEWILGGSITIDIEERSFGRHSHWTLP